MQDIEDKFKNSIASTNEAWEEIKKHMKASQSETSKELTKLKQEYDDLNQKYKDAQEKVDHIEGQLNETVGRLESMSKTTSKGVDAMQLLDVYLVLMESVFESGPHVRLLLMLHGDADEYTMKTLTDSSGIGAIQVRQAIMELRKAGVLEYDDETTVVKLIQRFL